MAKNKTKIRQGKMVVHKSETKEYCENHRRKTRHIDGECFECTREDGERVSRGI